MNMKFDYSEFHPLDHSIFDPYCWGWAGGIPRHIKLWYEYQFQWPWVRAYRAWRCRQGLHNITVYWTGPKGPWQHDGDWGIAGRERPADGFMCYDCEWGRWLCTRR